MMAEEYWLNRVLRENDKQFRALPKAIRDACFDFCQPAIAMEAFGRDGETRLDAKHDSAGPQDIAQKDTPQPSEHP